ncbi:SRPBCC family protein [Streptomyces albipurpureus]|uniref:SRPBCC family protein n=1 Tax=Streptomyces albipurpureus TaxID=2897419 RepID=A0ABT0URN9_9ACTN|nr:SRPBCC family protein [Streptomyces sp. CWNU-1]MCM2390654.1 SRPBCC family protein [Streptomyces sp. CWNU-1]
MAEKTSLLSADNPAVSRLKEEAQSYLVARAEQALASTGRLLGKTTTRLNGIADGSSPGLARLAVEGGRKAAQGKGPVRSAIEAGASQLKDKATDALKGLGGKRSKGGGGKHPVVILESVDVGVPVRTAYDQWTRFQDFASFARGVRSATAADDTSSDWQVKVFWSSRSWKARTTEQIPDSRIQWTSEGAKGSTKGVVTFHPLGDNLTRVLLVLEYYPKGLFEKTGNIWRAQGRRARLDLKNYARHISLLGEVEDGWRGEIRDGEVVLSHDDALADEAEEDAPDEADAKGGASAHGSDDEAADGEDGEDGEDGDEDAYDEEYDEEPGEFEDEPEDAAEDAEDAEDAEEDADEEHIDEADEADGADEADEADEAEEMEDLEEAEEEYDESEDDREPARAGNRDRR